MMFEKGNQNLIQKIQKKTLDMYINNSILNKVELKCVIFRLLVSLQKLLVKIEVVKMVIHQFVEVLLIWMNYH